MRLELKTITAVIHDPEEKTLSLGLDEAEPVTIQDGEQGLDIARDLPWLAGATDRKALVAVDSSTGQVLPASVALEVGWGHEGPNADGHYVIFGPPRPGAMYLDPEAAEADEMLASLTAAIKDGQGAAFALRDAVWIEDVRVLERDTAMRYLGFAAQ